MILILIYYFIFTFLTFKKENILNNYNIKIENKISLYKNRIFLYSFLIIYLGLIRILRIFLDPKIINVSHIIDKIFSTQYNIVYILFLGISLLILFNILKKFLIQNLKLSFIRIIYYNISKSDNFFNFYVKVTCWQNLFWLWLTVQKLKLHEKNNGRFFFSTNLKIVRIIKYFFKYIAITLLILFFFFDIFFNHLNLILFCTFLPYFALYQSIFYLNRFLNNSLNPRYDACCVDYFYPPARYGIQPLDYKTVFEIFSYVETICKF